MSIKRFGQLERYQMPDRICSDFNGYTELSKMLHAFKDVLLSNLEIDFQNSNWFEANLSAVLGAAAGLLESNLNNVNFINVEDKFSNILARNEFLSHFNHPLKRGRSSKKSYVPYRKFKTSEDKLFKQHIDMELIPRDIFPNVSTILGKKISESLFEVFVNARLHSECDHIFTCGQFYPSKNPPRLDFTIVNMGKTIPDNVDDYFLEVLQKPSPEGSESLEWAMQEGNTTKRGDNPGGLGLSLIRDFVQANKGKMQIVSGTGYWEMKKGKTQKHTFAPSFPGTIVNLEFNYDESDYYFLSSEVDLNNIF